MISSKPQIIEAFKNHYGAFIDYINTLSPGQYFYSPPQKWNAQQQLEHIVICVKPLLQVYSMEKPRIEQTFGKTSRPGISYNDLLAEYESKLKQGGAAPSRYVPGADSADLRPTLTAELNRQIAALCLVIETFSDEELDTLLIPHPLLGNITLREMLFNAIYHVQHHHNKAKENLQAGNS